MKHYITLLFTLIMLGAVGQSDENKQTPKQKCCVTVNFGSPGTGIDTKTYEDIMARINEKKLKYTEKSYGREGETKICLPLKELRWRKKKQFIDQLKKIAASGQYVSVTKG